MLDFIFKKTIGQPAPDGCQLIRGLLDRLIEYASEPCFAESLAAAREIFYAKAGKTNEDDRDFIQRMNTFLEWFIFDYRPEGAGTRSVYDKFLDEKRKETSSADMINWIALSRQVHSMFLVRSCASGVTTVRDLAGRRNYVVTGDDHLEAGDILESRVICVGKGCFFTYTHVLHPKTALRPIRAELKKYRNKPLGEELFFKLQGMQLKWRRFRQISIEDIYRM